MSLSIIFVGLNSARNLSPKFTTESVVSDSGADSSYAAGFLVIKDGAYYCYCAYVLRISRYSGFLWVVPTNTGIFLRGLKLCGESRTQQMLLASPQKIGGNHAFFRDN